MISDEHPGLCLSDYQGNCTDVSDGGKLCFLDNECGHLEKCCSNGCDMGCTTYMRDESRWPLIVESKEYFYLKVYGYTSLF